MMCEAGSEGGEGVSATARRIDGVALSALSFSQTLYNDSGLEVYRPRLSPRRRRALEEGVLLLIAVMVAHTP